ncbi:MAG: DUF1501 domain-containing protein [Myxococcota bacterium]
MNRRTFLSSAAALSTLGWAGQARAAVANADRKFVFVFAEGGWDPTRVFVPAFSNPAVAMEAAAEQATTSGLPWVEHPDRPNVSAFFSRHASRTLLFNGVLVRSIAHDICRMIAMTGDSSGLKPDWPALIATEEGLGRYTVPHLVMGGPSFPGPLGSAVARTGASGQLEALITGDIVGWSDAPPSELSVASQNLVDRYVRGRSAAAAARVPTGNAAAGYAAYAQGVASATALKDLKYVMDFTGGTSLSDQATVAVDALAIGAARCLTLTEGGNWDSHADNDAGQTQRFESMFSGLNQLFERLGAAPGTAGGATLLEETTVVVLSEMGRTPQLNGFMGKDHWPYTSVMVVSDGVTGGRVVGGFDELFYGYPVDPTTGENDPDGPQLLSIEAVGATLLAMADVDPAEHILGVDPILGVLR